MTRVNLDRGKPSGQTLVEALRALTDVLHRLDKTDPDTDSVAFDRTTDDLVTAARATVRTAKSVIEDSVVLATALQDAAADRRDLSGWCRACEQAYDGLCADHEDNLAQADAYDALRTGLVGALERH